MDSGIARMALASVRRSPVLPACRRAAEPRNSTTPIENSASLALAFFPITQLARSGVESHYNHVNHMGGPFNARSSAREGLSQGAGVFALAVGVFGLKVGARLWV